MDNQELFKSMNNYNPEKLKTLLNMIINNPIRLIEETKNQDECNLIEKIIALSCTECFSHFVTNQELNENIQKLFQEFLIDKKNHNFQKDINIIDSWICHNHISNELMVKVLSIICKKTARYENFSLKSLGTLLENKNIKYFHLIIDNIVSFINNFLGNIFIKAIEPDLIFNEFKFDEIPFYIVEILRKAFKLNEKYISAAYISRMQCKILISLNEFQENCSNVNNAVRLDYIS